MKLSAPTQNLWAIAVILGVLGVLGKLVLIPVLSANAFWLVTLGFAVLVLATVFKGA